MPWPPPICASSASVSFWRSNNRSSSWIVTVMSTAVIVASMMNPMDPHTAANRAILEYTQIRTLMALGRGAEGRALLDSMARFVKMAGSVRARIAYSTAVGLVEIAEGHLDRGRSRIHAAREKANLVSSTLPDVLSAQATMHRILGEEDEAGKVQDELNAIRKVRQETARLRAALVLGPVGVAGRTTRVTEYDRRLDAARERLLRSDNR